MPFYIRTLNGKKVAAGEKAVIECFRCGVCCIAYQAPVEAADIRRLARATGMKVRDFKAAYLQDTPMGYLIRQGKKGCIFLDTEGVSGLATCRVHRSRPHACRRWEASLEKPECRQGLAEIRGLVSGGTCDLYIPPGIPLQSVEVWLGQEGIHD